MVGERNQNVFLIQIDASSFAEFEISDCITKNIFVQDVLIRATRMNVPMDFMGI